MNLAKVMIPPGFQTVPEHVEHLIGDGARHVILRTEDAGLTHQSVWSHLHDRGFTRLIQAYPEVDWWIQVGNEPERYHTPPTPLQYRSQLVSVIDNLRGRSELRNVRWMAGVPITKQYGDTYFSGTAITSRYHAHAANIYGHWHIGDTGSEKFDQYQRAVRSSIPVWIAETGINGALNHTEKANRILQFWQNLMSDPATAGKVHGVTLFTLGTGTHWPNLEINEAHAQVFAGRDGKRTRWFAETSYQMADPFLTFWESQGGLQRFGFPVSGEIEEDRRIVQYTERTRLEFHPNNPPEWRILLGHLGRHVFQEKWRRY